MNDPEKETNRERYQGILWDAALELAQSHAGSLTDLILLASALEENAANRDFPIAAIYLKRMFEIAKFSSDFIDIAKLLRKFPDLQDYLSLEKCIVNARGTAVIPGDLLEIKQFLSSLRSPDHEL